MKATNRTGDNEETHEWLIAKIYEQLTQLNTKTKNKKKMGRRHFSKEDIQINKKNMKRCLTLLSIQFS